MNKRKRYKQQKKALKQARKFLKRINYIYHMEQNFPNNDSQRNK